MLFAPNLADPVPVHLRTPAGVELKTRFLGLSYYSALSGQSVMIGEVQDTVGELAAEGNRIVYPDCLSDCRADLVYTVTKATFDQDIVLREQPPTPEAYGLPASSLLLALTEFIDAPTPEEHRSLGDGGSTLATNNVDVTQLPARTLTFGGMTLGMSRAFLAGEEQDSVAVDKTWKLIEGRRFLIESVPWAELAPRLGGLPKGAAPTAARAREGLREYVRNHPVRREVVRREGESIRQTGVRRSGAGLVLDYSAGTTSVTNMTLEGTTTYYVSGPFIMNGVTTIEGGTVVKFAPTNSARIRVQGTVRCLTSLYNPAVFTARDDQTVGAAIPGSNSSPSGYYADTALELADNTADLRHLRIAWAGRGIVYGSGSGWPQLLSHVQFVNCGYGVTAQSPVFWVRNGLFGNVVTNFHSTATNTVTGHCEHLTVDSAAAFTGATNLTLDVTNSLLVAVSTNYGTWSGSGNATASSATGLFEKVGAGAYYLASGSPHRDAGVTNISYALSADFYQCSTYPPLALSNATVAVDTVWAPQAQRDTAMPDLGYHPPALDYLVTGVSVADATLVLTNGVAVGYGGAYGFRLDTGGKVASEGGPVALNRLVRSASVQEQTESWGSGGTAQSLFEATGSPGGSPEVRLRFAEVTQLADAPERRHLLNVGTNGVIAALALSDCLVHGAYLYLDPTGSGMTIGLTNNCFERPDLTWFHSLSGSPSTLYLRNNLFWRGAVRLYRNTTGSTWEVKDNAFDTVGLTNGSVSFVNAYNGYIDTAPLAGGSSNVVVTNFEYAAGPLGRYYQASTHFQDAGSRTGGEAGLYHQTTRLAQAKECDSTVDIGLHYVAVTPAEVEVAKSGLAPTASSTGWSWYASYATNTQTTDPGWHNSTYTGTAEFLRIGLGSAQTVSRVGYIPRVMTANIYDGSRNGVYREYEIYVTDSATNNPADWGTPVAVGEWRWPNLQERREVEFEPKSGAYVYYRRVSAYGWYSIEDPNYPDNWYPGYANVNEAWIYRRASVLSLPLDEDGDGLPDYFEDRNGNGGDPDAGETDWQASENGTSDVPGLQVYTPME